MASYFGEVIHPSSRAFWIDDDDELLDSDQNSVKFTINWIMPEPQQFEKFIIAEGDMVIDFLTKTLLENKKSVCTIGCALDKSNAKIYLVESSYICTISTKLNLTEAGLLTETIAPLILKSKDLIALTSNHVSYFKGEEINSGSFLKSLHSGKARNNKSFRIPALNQPNIVTGVCAGVLSYADVNHLHCIMYILYTDTFILDSKNGLPLAELISDFLGKTLPVFATGGSSFFNKGNLYM